MTKEEFIKLQGNATYVNKNIGTFCSFPALEKVSYLMHTHNASFDTIVALAKELDMEDKIKDENSRLSWYAYKRINELLVDK